jgi:hypothetical protein
VEGDELVSRMHGHPNDIFGEAGFRSSGRVNDVTWNRECLGNLLLFGEASQSRKAAAPATTSYLPEFSPLAVPQP